MPPHDDCPQAPTIQQMADTLHRMETTQKDLVSTMTKVAEQSANIQHNTENITILKKDVDSLFGRVREMEVVMGKNGEGLKMALREIAEEETEHHTADLQRRIQLVESTNKTVERLLILFGNPYFKAVVIILVVMVIVGTTCDVVYHYPLFKKVADVLLSKSLP